MTSVAQFAPRFGWAVLVAASAVGAVLLSAVPASAHRIEKRFTVDGRPVVIVHHARGRVEVKSWKKREVVVVGNHSSDNVEVDTEQAGDRIEVTTHVLTQNVQPADLQADYTLTVPEETKLQVRNDAGTVIVERVFGDLSFETVAADVQLQEVAGYLVVKTVGGGLVCTRCAGSIDVNTISGKVQLFQPVSDNVRVQTTSGDIYFDGDFHRGGVYMLKSFNGVIEVRFSDTDSFDLTATAPKVENQATLKPDTHPGRHPAPRFSKSLIGTFNEGHAKVELSSFNGTIRIRKRD